jgi:hypothetical protein
MAATLGKSASRKSPLTAVATVGDRAGGQVEVGVRHDDHRAGGAQLQRELFDPRHARDSLTDGSRPGERDLSDAPVRDQQIAQLAARTGQHRQHAVRQSGIDETACERQGCQRRGACGLEDNRVARGQRWRDLVQNKQGRIVEWGDRDYHAARLT